MSNSEKEIITKENIVGDIKHSLKKPPTKTRSEYRMLKIVAFVASILLVILEIIMRDLTLTIISIVLFITYDYIVLFIKRINVRFKNYEVKSAVLSHREHEVYSLSTNYGSVNAVNDFGIYTLFFENRQSYRIPEDNFTWAPLRQISDSMLYNSSNPGDEFIIIVKKRTGKIAMAYPKKHFEYAE